MEGEGEEGEEEEQGVPESLPEDVWWFEMRRAFHPGKALRM